MFTRKNDITRQNKCLWEDEGCSQKNNANSNVHEFVGAAAPNAQS